MLVHLIARPQAGHSHIPRSGLHLIAEGIRATGAQVLEDAWTAGCSDRSEAVSACADELRTQWRKQQPDVIHAVGIVAAMAALQSEAPAPVLVTFDDTEDAPVEQDLASRADAVVPLSQVERERWRRRGVRTLSSGSFPFCVPVPDVDACARPGGDVLTFSTGADLEPLVESMPHWTAGRLILLGRLSGERLAEVQRAAEAVGVADLLVHRPGLRGRELDQVWSNAALLVAGSETSRHAAMLLAAAARGIPAVATAEYAHLDHVVGGTTGVLVEPHAGPRVLGKAIDEVLTDSFGMRAMGTSALVRLNTLHSLEIAGRRLMSLYEDALTDQAELATGGSTLHPIGEERCALALEHMSLARQLAGWYSGRGQRREDLIQVASLGLVRAAERFDPAHGKEFHSFAIPTILGELRRHFRDHAWAVRVPRSLQETTLQVQRTSEQLRQSLGRDASLADVAQELGLVEEEVLQALRADGEARSSHSLDHPVGEDESLADLVGDIDPALDLVELRRDVRAALRRLPEREQQILLMRFFGERTQSEIADRLGISQVHVSRVLSRTLAALRDYVLYDVPLPKAWESAEPAPSAASNVPCPRKAS